MSGAIFSEDAISSGIRKLDPSETLGHDKIYTRMIELNNKTICKPLHMIYISSLENWVFYRHGKWSTLFLSIEKKVSNLLRNIWNINLRCILILFNLASLNQSDYQWGFKQGDSCISQLFSITHETYNSFDEWFVVREVFFDISKALINFGTKVWYRMEWNFGKLLLVLRNFLASWK